MTTLDPLHIREVFHLCFLQAFLRHFDSKFVTLKGGVNLRLFFKSPRYSEDMDLDVVIASVPTLQKNVLHALKAISFPMKAHGVVEIIPQPMERAKQTETTQRFKIRLHTRDGLDLLTKIEFSRRGQKGMTQFEHIDETLIRVYRMAPLILQHYSAASAYEQKVAALAGRTVTQARDLFDLHLLIPHLPENFILSLPPTTVEEAAQRAEEISFERYRESVVAYLTRDDQSTYNVKEVWEAMQRRVCGSLMERRHE